MTTANVNIKKVLLRRGNTTQNDNYTGVFGEITVDTQLKTLRIHDGVTVGGNIVTASGAVGSYSNVNTAAYLTSQSITSANIGAFQVYANANAASQTTEINSLRANITAANTVISGLTSNAAIQAALLDTLTGNAATQSTVLDTLTSNAATQTNTLTTLLANAVSQETSLISLLGNAATQATFINSRANLSGATFTGNVTVPYLFANNNVHIDGYVLVGSEHDQGILYKNPAAIFFGNTYNSASDKYFQLNLQNADPSGSGDIVITADDGTDTSNYITIGINGSSYLDPSFPDSPGSSPHDGYIYMTGGNLVMLAANGNIVIGSNIGGLMSTNSVDNSWDISGNLTLADNILGQANNSSNLGADYAYFKNSYVGNVYATTITTGNILPSANVAYSLGSSTNQWKDLWVSNNTIYIGNTPLTVSNGNLLVNGSLVTGSGTDDELRANVGSFYTYANLNYGTSSYANANVAAYLTGNTVTTVNTTGNIKTVANVIGTTFRFANGVNILSTVSTGLAAPSQSNSNTNYNIVMNNSGTLVYGTGNGGTAATLNPYTGYISVSGMTIGGYGVTASTGFDYVVNLNSRALTFTQTGNLSVPGNVVATSAYYGTQYNFANGISILSGLGSGTANLVNGASTFQLFANGQSRSPDTIFASNGVSILGANNTIQGGMYNSGDADWLNIGASTGRGIKFYVNEEDAGPLFFANGSANVPNTLYSTSGVIGDVGMYGGTIWGNNPNWNNLTIASQIEGYSYVQIPSDATANVANLRIHNDIGNIEISTGDGITYYNSYFTRYGELKLSNGLVFDINGSINATGGTAIFQSTDYDLRLRANTNGTMKEWGFSEDGTLTFPTSGNVVFDSSSTSIIDGVTDINAVGTIGANVIRVLSDLTSFGASPAPVIYGFSSISTTGSAVNEGNISASGNLVASQGAYVSGNVFAARYNFANGVNILSTVGAGSYGNTQVAEYLPTFTGNSGAARVQVTNAVDFMYGGYPYMGWQLSGSDTLKLRTNIASGDYTNDAIIVDRQSLAVNVVATLTAGNIVTSHGLFWSNGTSYSSGGAASTGNITFSDTTISTSGGAGQGIILNSAGAGEIAMLDYVGINNTNPGYWLHVGDGAPGAVNNTGNISIDYNNGLDSSRASTIIGYAWWDAGGNGNNNRGIGAHRQFGIYKNDDLYTTKYLEIDLTSGNANLTNISVSRVTTTNGIFWSNGLSILNDLASQSYVTTQINNLVNNAPALLDTLGEIAANLATEANAVGSVLNSLTNINANVTAANLNITSLQSNAGSQQASIDTLLNRVNQEVNNTSSPQFAGLTTTANVELTGNVHIHQNLVVDGNINFIGNVTQTNITTANAVFTGDTYGFGALYAGVLGYTPLPYTVIQATADYNDYSQINFQNLNLSANASTEWVATAGNGNDTTNFIDIGIAGSAWNGTQYNSIGTAAKANDGWLYILGNTAAGTGGNLVLGTVQPGKRVNILTGGPGSSNIYSYFNSSGLTTANVSATNYLYANGVNILTGITGTYSNTNVAGYLAGNITTGNIQVGIAMRINGTTQTIDTANGSSIIIGSRINLTGSAGGYGLSVTHPAQFASNLTVGTNSNAASFYGMNYFYTNGVSILSGIGGTYSNTNVEAYIGGNIGAFQIFSNANSAAQATSINSINANIGAYQIYANANAAAQSITIVSINDNLGSFQTFANANAAAQATGIDTINANIGAFQTYANLTFTGGGGGSTYSNTNVAAYLTTATITTSGNITAANLIATSNVYTSNIITTGATSGNISGANYVSANVVQISSGLLWANGTPFTSGTTYTSSGAGNITVSGSTLALTATGPSAVAVGSSAAIPVITPDGYGRIASLSTAAVVAPAGTLTGTTLAATVVTSSLTSVGTLGSLTVTGNITAGNTSVTQVSATTGVYTSNVTALNFITTGTYGNITNANVISANNVVISGFGVTMANRPAFRIYGGAPSWFNTSNVNLKGSSIVVDYNQGNYFNSTTGVFTAPVAGLYSVTLNARVGSLNSQSQIVVGKNGLATAGNVAVMWETDTNTGTAIHFGVASTVKLAVGDWLSANITVGNVQFDQNDSWSVTYIG